MRREKRAKKKVGNRLCYFRSEALRPATLRVQGMCTPAVVKISTGMSSNDEKPTMIQQDSLEIDRRI